MDFLSRIARLPIPFDTDRGAETGALVPGIDGNLTMLLAGAGGCSPYLKSLVEKEAPWLPQVFENPEAAISALFSDLSEVAPDVMPGALRQAKRRVALTTGLADLAGVWSLEEVTGTLTRFADLACSLALQTAVGAEIRRGKLPGASEADLESAGGMVVLAMGKNGRA